jgi:ribonuclease D
MPAYPEGAIDVASTEALQRVVSSASAAPELAVDAEADALHAFRPRLCFIQIATDADVFLIDTLAAGIRLGALSQAFGDPAKTKYFHAAGGDLQYLADEGVRVQGLFDTHRAATLLGWQRVGLADLVSRVLQVDLPKEHQQADFSIRPLPDELRRYIADDVRYLCELGRRMRQECERADILEEVQLDCRRLEMEALSRPEIGSDFKVKLSRPGLSPAQRALGKAIAQRLHQLRLSWAEAANVPFGRVLSNAAIAALASQPPEALHQLAKAPHVRGRFVREHGAEVLSSIADVVSQWKRGEVPIAADERKKGGAAQQKREEALRTFRSARAAERKVTPSVVLSNSLVAELTKNPPHSLEELAQLPFFGEKRLRLYGSEILQLLGKTA